MLLDIQKNIISLFDYRQKTQISILILSQIPYKFYKILYEKKIACFSVNFKSLLTDIKFIMKCFRFLFAVFFGTLVYVLISVPMGNNGFFAEKKLKEQKQIISAHTASIENINSELSLEKNALEHDLDVIAAYAKKLGYVSENEKLIKVSGLPSRETHVFNPGTAEYHRETSMISEGFCKIAALIVMVLVYMILLIMDINRGLVDFSSIKNIFKSSQSVTIYDMQ